MKSLRLCMFLAFIAVLRCYALYLEEVTDGALVLAEVGVVTEGDDGTVYIDPYNFTGNTGYDPRTFDPASLKSLTWDQVQGHSDCKDAFVLIKPLTFTFSWADCRHAAVNGVRYKAEATLTCDNMTAIFTAGYSETPTLVPYNFLFQGHKFPLPNAPGDYVCNCDNSRG